MLLSKIITRHKHNFYFQNRVVPLAGRYYFSVEDFTNLKQERFTFNNLRGQKLAGFIYHYDNFDDAKIVIFVHGYGAGHRSYMKEIEYLARNGFNVFSFDTTGSWESEGDSLVGFYEIAMSLKSLLIYLSTNDKYKDKEIYLVGHSLGGYSVLQSLNFKEGFNIKKIVAISGFKSMETAANQYLNHYPKCFKKDCFNIEKNLYGNDIFYDPTEELKITDKKVFIIHSEDDNVVSYLLNFVPLSQAAFLNKNAKVLSVNGHKHNPTYTIDSCLKLEKYFLEVDQLKSDKAKNEFSQKFDWEDACKLDIKVMNSIIDFLKENGGKK